MSLSTLTGTLKMDMFAETLIAQGMQWGFKEGMLDELITLA